MVDTVELARSYLRHLENREWDTWAAMLDPEVTYSTPQSGEQWRGRDAFLRFNQEYPGEWHLAEKWILGDAGRAAIWFTWTVGEESGDAQSFITFDESGKVVAVTEFWPEPYEVPERSTPATERL